MQRKIINSTLFTAILLFLLGCGSEDQPDSPAVTPSVSSAPPSLTIEKALQSTLDMVENPSAYHADAVLAKVAENATWLDSAKASEPCYDDLLMVSTAASFMLLDRARWLHLELKGKQNGETKITNYEPKSDKTKRLFMQKTKEAPKGKLSDKDQRRLGEIVFKKFMPKISLLKNCTLEADGPLAEYVKQLPTIQDEFAQLMKKVINDFSKQDNNMNITTKQKEDFFNTSMAEMQPVMQSIEAILLHSSMHSHMTYMIKSEQWDDFKTYYPAWTKNPVTSKWAHRMGMLVQIKHGEKKAKELGCWVAPQPFLP